MSGALTRQRCTLIKVDLDKLYTLLEGESFLVDHEATESCRPAFQSI